MDTNDLVSDNRDASGNHRSIPLRKANSLSRLPTPQQAPVRRSPPRTPQPTKSSTGIPLVKAPLLSSASLVPPPRTKRDSHHRASSQSSLSSSSPSPTKTYEGLNFTYGTKAKAPVPPPMSAATASSYSLSSSVFSSPSLAVSGTKPRSPIISKSQASSEVHSITAAPTSSSNRPNTSSSSILPSSPTMSQPRSPPAVMTKPQLGLTSPQRPPRERIRSHSPPTPKSPTPLSKSPAPAPQQPKSPPPPRQRVRPERERTPSPPPPAPSRPPPPEVTRVVRSEARQFVNPDVPGYVGFANLPNQVHRKSVKKGFEFTLMVVGESGLGKSTLVNSLFLTDLYPERQLADAAEKIKKTVKIDASTVEIEERGVKLRLTVVDTPGFADALNNGDCFKTIISYIDDQFERYLHDESGLNRRHIVDNRVHCCFYFVNPAGHGLKPLDISFMKAIHHKVNIVPVIAKADTLTKAEVLKMKKKILRQVHENGIVIYQLPDCDDDEDEDYKEQCRQLKEAVPFAVVGANQVIEVRGRKVRGRMYPWGVVEVENPDHCDFIKLRTMLITHMQDLQEVTQEIHYENFRSEKLATSDGVVRKPKTPRTSRVENDAKEAKLSEKEQALKEKEYELKRMQEMLSKMQAEMRQQQQTTQRPKAEAPPPPSARPGALNGHSAESINNNTKQLNAQKA